MRHRVKDTRLGTDTKHRKAMIRSLLRNLFERGEIKTNKTRARETKRWADKLILKAQDDSVASRRNLHKFFGKRDIVNTLVDKIAPVYGEKKSGFTRITPAFTRRGDNVEMFSLSLTQKPEKLGLKSGKKHELKPKSKKVETKSKVKQSRKPKVIKKETKK